MEIDQEVQGPFRNLQFASQVFQKMKGMHHKIPKLKDTRQQSEEKDKESTTFERETSTIRIEKEEDQNNRTSEGMLRKMTRQTP